MFKDRYIILYVLLWELYFLQGTLGFQGAFSQILLIFLLAVSAFYCYKVNVSKVKSQGIKAVNILLLLVVVYGLYLIIQGQDSAAYGRAYYHISRFDYLKIFLISLLPIYFFYYNTRNKEISQRTCIFLLFVFLVGYTLSFYTNLYEVTDGDEEKEITNNVGYYFLSIVPLVYLIKERLLLKTIAIGFISFYIIMSLKRGAMLVGGICLVLFLYNNFRYSSRRNKFIVCVLSITLLFLMYNYVIDFYNSSDYFQYRYEQTLEGESSGRDNIYSSMISGFLDQSNIFSILFGNGADATIRLYGSYAHNDWLEFLTNQGLVGVVIYAIYWSLLYKTWKKAIGNISLCLGTFILIYFTITFFSMSANDYSPCASLCLGYCLAHSNNNKR